MTNIVQKLSIIIPAYNAQEHIGSLLCSIENQKFNQQIKIEIIVVNDASTDNTALIVRGHKLSNITLITHSKNLGRSRTINAGIQKAASSFCILFDSDCKLSKSNILQLYINSFNLGFAFCFGFTSNKGNSFWGKYQRDVSKTRMQSGDPSKQTTANFGFLKNKIEKIGCFSTEYTAYGFEDRDLILRIIKHTNQKDIFINPNIVVEHDDELKLTDIVEKLYISAKYSAPIFARKHYNSYKISQYGKLDYEISQTILAKIFSLFSNSYNYLLPLTESIIRSKITPYQLKKIITKIVMGLAYAKGCKDRYTKGDYSSKNS